MRSTRNIVLFSLIFFLIEIKCNVTNSVKDDETTKGPENSREFKKGNGTKVVERRVYLEDVMYALKDHNWTADEKPCLNQTLLMLHSLQNFTLWAVWGWDSIASEPTGLLFGNRYQLGNFDECMKVPWSGHPELMNQYCLAEIVLDNGTTKKSKQNLKQQTGPYRNALDYMLNRPEYTRPLNELTWGICVPAVCQPKSVERLLSLMLTRSHLGTTGIRSKISISEPCQRADKPTQFDALYYSFVVTVVSLTVVCFICTFLNNRRKDNTKSTKYEIIRAFCIKENAVDLLKMKKEGLEVIYGIRFLTICFIVFDHQIGITNSAAVSDGQEFDKKALNTQGLFVLHDDLFVDSFFLISGFLAAVALKTMRRLPNPVLFIIKRYVRLSVAYAVVIFYVCAVFPFAGSGPLWQRAIAADTEPCRENWWLSLLMLNNYIDSENICIVVSWYIPCDFHFFVVTLILYFIYKSHSRAGIVLAGLVAAASIIIPGIITYAQKLPAAQLFTYEFIINPRDSRQFHLTYIKSHARFAAYIVGFSSGYIFATYKATGNLKRITKKWSIIGASIGLLTMLVMLLLGPVLLFSSHPVADAVYAALNRPVWAAGLAMLVLCAAFGEIPILKSFLSWYPWVPLSRLSYGLYLTHSIFIARNAFIARNPQHNDMFEICVMTAGVIFFSCVAALLIWLLAEAPANNLLALCLRPKVKKVPEDIDKATPSTSISNIAASTSQLQQNLPQNIQCYSKM